MGFFEGFFFHWENHPCSVKELSETWLLGNGPLPIKLTLFVFAGFAWAIWNNRNKMSIRHEFPKSPSDIVYIAILFMQKSGVCCSRKVIACASSRSRRRSCDGWRAFSLLSWCRLISAKFRCVSLAFVVGAVATKPVSGARFLLMLSWNWYSQSVPNSIFLKSRGCASFF